MRDGLADPYDFVVVGAGSAGGVLASRLSADPAHRVLLLEAGGETHPLSRVPLSYGLFIDRPGVNWRYRSVPDPEMGNRPIPVPRGRMLGGSSAINGLVFVRGQARDYDTWAQLGCRGWSYADVLPVFRRMESFEGGADEWRGGDGPLRIGVSPDDLPLYDALMRAGTDLGIPANPDYNGARQEGIVKTQVTARRGRRMSVDHCYLRPARRRPNLHVRTGAHALRLRLDGRRCTGVDFRQGGRVLTATARREVLVCAGAIASPQLLELSGIGRPEVLRSHGIEVRHALPGVGENLRDHLAPRVVYSITRRGVTYNDRMQGLGRLREALRYVFTGRGFPSIPSAPLLGFIRTRGELADPDLQIHFVPFAIADVTRRTLMREPGMTVTYYQMRPESRGSVHIRSPDPDEHPAIEFRFLSDPLDRRTVVDGMRWTRRIMAAPAMAGLAGPELTPGPEVETDEEILDWVRATAVTAYHPTCTCAMGVDPMAVVDPELRIHGLEGVRIADGSIMPTLVSGNTNAACIMIGEKAAEMVLGM